MASCKNCVHVDVCRGIYLAVISGKINSYEEFLEKCDKEHFEQQDFSPCDCLFYRDRSRFVELPCKVGDFVYLVTDFRKIGKYLVTSILIRKSLVDLNWKMIDGVGYPTPFARAEEIGKTVFLSREEAERALKERENGA